MSRARLLVLGAGMAQVPIIQKCLNKGFEVLVASTPGKHPGFTLATHVFEIDIRDGARLLEVARREGVSGVLTDQTDVGVPSVAFIAQSLGLPGIGTECALNFTDKLRMRRAANALGVPTPAFCEVTRGANPANAVTGIDLPVVVKPADSQGSRGVQRVDRISDLPATVNEAMHYSPSGRVIIEEYFEGVEVVVQGFASNFRFWNVAIGDRAYFELPGLFIPQSTLFPSALPSSLQDSILDLNRRLVTGLAPRFGISHSEFLVNAETGEVRLVEVAMRGGGAFIASDLVPHASGLDLNGLLVDHASGRVDAVDLDAVRRDARSAGYFFCELPEGVIAEVSGVEQAKALPGVRRLVMNGIEVGKKTHRLRDKTERAGPVVVYGEKREDCLAALERVKQTLRVLVRTPQGLEAIRW